MKLFKKGEDYSWRAILTAIVGFVFAFSCIAIIFGKPALPDQYLYIIGGVFGFYFFKNAKLPFELKPKKDETK